ncbi:ABC transporter ATP-binding protein [Labrys miyagiensis]|uniref:ABC transporter ATP-binding protein n=1 Tax=Labrys miyagiensis TaxID=346912 RepID=A0ABQ6CGW5_9HYPH|nr:ABC transporter ATP-binding protein [Labrys miyagiensis]GLS19577.1 ABC transporter ATP-binding protein [Labrys miyagiensis]
MGLTLENVSKTVGAETHISDVSLTLESGSLNVLLGPTLSGKTSLMRLMAGLDRPSAGRVVVDGKDVTGAHVRTRSVAMVYQQFINYPSLSVYENIASPLRVKKRPAAEIDAEVRQAARLLKLDAMLDRTPLQLSGGQQQRTAIARAIVKRADLVLLDEPLANLDYKLREELREELPRIFEASGAVFVYATTEPQEALLLGGNTATLWQGRISQFGRTIEVYRRPKDLATAQVFSDPPMNVFSARKQGSDLRLPTGEVVPASGTTAGLADGDYHLGIRPNHLLLEPPGQDALRLPSIVSVTEISGSESFVHADYHDDRFVALVPGVREIVPGAPVDLFVSPSRLFVFDTAGRLAAAPVA